MRSAWPSAVVRQASTTRPWRFSKRTYFVASAAYPLLIVPPPVCETPDKSYAAAAAGAGFGARPWVCETRAVR